MTDSPLSGLCERALITHLDDLLSAQGDQTYREYLRVPALSAGLFAVRTGHDDRQQPHLQDEVYVVLGGRAALEVDGTPTPVAAGSIAYVPARLPHRFVDISEDLRVVVLFAPPEDPSEP
jgi:mannose-6-phosphate isomerase-like protein (cupin superfamily)